jgi:hypothetical protein
VVTDTVWLGSTAATAKLELLTLPETATEVWGEVSADGGRTWARWENFQLREDDSGYAAMFSLSDSSPRHFRVRTSNSREALYWCSDAFLLPENGTEDQGGNRGGSITPIAPVRTPAPVQSPEVSVTPSPEPTPAPAVPAPTPEPPEPTPAPAAQGLFAVLGLTVCGLFGAAITRAGPFKKRK